MNTRISNLEVAANGLHVAIIAMAALIVVFPSVFVGPVREIFGLLTVAAFVAILGIDRQAGLLRKSLPEIHREASAGRRLGVKALHVAGAVAMILVILRTTVIS